jgi:hypothetical protein
VGGIVRTVNRGENFPIMSDVISAKCSTIFLRSQDSGGLAGRSPAKAPPSTHCAAAAERREEGEWSGFVDLMTNSQDLKPWILFQLGCGCR